MAYPPPPRTGHDYAAAPVTTRRVEQSGHHDRVGTKQIGFAGGAPPQVLFIGIDGVADFLNLPKRRNDRLAIEDRRYLFFGEPVAFDHQRPANGTDAIGPSKAQIRPDRRFLRPPDSLADAFGKIENGRSDGVWRRFGHKVDFTVAQTLRSRPQLPQRIFSA